MSAALYRAIEVGTWDDSRFLQLSAPSANAQTLWLYLLSGPPTGVIPGLYVFSVGDTAERFRWSTKATRKVFEEITDAGMALFDAPTRLLWLPKAADRRCNTPNSLNVVKAWRKAWERLPPSQLRSQAGCALYSFLLTKSLAFAHEFGEAKAYDHGSSKALDTPPANATQEAGSRKQEISSGVSPSLPQPKAMSGGGS